MLNKKTIKQVRKSFRSDMPDWMKELAKSKGVPDFDHTEIDGAESLDDAELYAVMQTERLRDYLHALHHPGGNSYFNWDTDKLSRETKPIPDAGWGTPNEDIVTKFEHGEARTLSECEWCAKIAVMRWTSSVFPFIDRLRSESNRIVGEQPGMAVELTRLKYGHDDNLRFMNNSGCDGYESLNEIIKYIRTLAEIVKRFPANDEWIITAGKIKQAKPEMTDKAIAVQLGIDPSTLSKNKKWISIRNKIEADERASRRG